MRVTTGSIHGDVLCEFALPAGQITMDTAAVNGVTDLYIILAGDVAAQWRTITP